MPSFLPPTTLRSRVFLTITILVTLIAVSLPLYFSRRVQAAGFTAGNIVVYRVGDGSAALGATATAVFLDEYTPAGVLVQSIPMPTAVVGSNRRLTASGSATTEGFLTLTSNGQYLAVPGYDAPLGTAAVAGTTSATVNRVVGRVDSAGLVDTTTAISDAFSTGNPRGATGDGGTNFWVAGSNSGVRLVTLGSSGASTSISTTATNLRVPNIFAGQLYISSGAGTIRVGTVGAGTPTTTGQTITNLPGFPATPSITGYFFADLSVGVAGVDTLYVADDVGNQVQKYSLVSGTWTANGSIAATAARGLTGTVSGTTVTLFGTLGATGGTLYRLVDTSGYNATISGSVTSIATPGTNRAFRGVAMAPASGPPNQAIVPTCPAGITTVAGTPASSGVSATDPDGTVTSATIISGGAPGITLDNPIPAASPGGTFTATLNVSNTTAVGTYDVVIQYSNNDSPTPQTASCTVHVTVNAPNQPISPNCPTPLTTTQGTATSVGVSATDPDGTVTSAIITSAPVAGITLDNFVPAAASGGTATATLNVSNTTATGTYNITIRYSNNDATPQIADCTVVVNVNVPADSVVISQVYGGGGNTGATLKNDFIELINHSSVPVNLNGWSVQAWSFSTNSWQVTPLTNFTLQPGQYYLVQEAQGAGGTDNLPTPDAVGTIAISSGSTKVALVSNTTAITGACPNAASGLIDLVGYGSDPIIGTCYEGSGAGPTLSNTIADQRRNEGCFDTDDNAADFVTIAPNPHNTASPVHDCTGLSAFGSANPSTIVQGDSTTLTVHVALAQNPSSTGETVTADLTSIGGSASQAFAGSGSIFTYVATVPANNPPGMKSLPVTVSDGQDRTANTNILLSILPIIPDHVTISQVYGGGGNSGATYSNDYVELYNPTAATISMTGWSIQYGPATGTTFTGKTVIGGTIAPGVHYLISLASGGAVGASLPTASVNGDINMAAGAGKVALVSNTQTLIGACPVGADPDIVDFVGYGTTANCHEGNANAPTPSNTTAIFRKNGGGTDADQNGNDFVVGAPNPRSESPVVEFGPSVANTDPGSNSTTAPYDSTITVDFSEPVTVDAGWYNITCSVTGSHNSPNTTEAHTDNLKTYAFTPNTSFQFGEQCTVTITKTAVHDVDTDDSEPGTDTMSDDFVWSFTVVGAGQPAPYPPSVHLTMGNPSNATASLGDFNNYLMEKPTYSLSYNRDKGTPNWVSWHLENTWYGTLARVDTFRPDPKVDPSWYRVQAFDYTNSGFDRGHMTPNADRDNQNRIPINQETYLMTNMVPQAPDNNQGPWADLEAYLRTQTDAGNEIYIVSGPQGQGGTGANGAMNTIANGHVTVPTKTWKVALIIPSQLGDDTQRVTCSSRALAVIMPNVQGIRNDDWHSYITTVDAVEQLTGYDLFSNLPPAVQACIEAGTDGTNPPGTADQSANTTEDNSVTITLEALRSNNNTLTFSIVGGPSHGSLDSVSAATCSGGSCTATVTYTPGADYNGPDSLTFRASDGSLNSNTSTVSVTVSEVNDSPVAADDSKSTQEDTPLSFSAGDLTGNDSAGPAEASQSLTVTSVTAGANTHGTVTLESGTTVTYTPAANFNGPASFTYNVCDDGTTNGSPDPKCAIGTVNVTVNAVNDAPDAINDSTTIAEDSGANTISVRDNDVDVENDTLTITAVTQGLHGSVAITGGGTTVSYTPNADYFGPDSFTYTINDGNGGSDMATVNVTVTNVNDAPELQSSVAMPLISATNSNLFNVGLTATATDKENEAVTIQVSVFGDENDETPTVNNTVHSPDAKDIAPITLRLRGERVEANDGRVYLIIVTATDSSGGVTRNYHTVVVPKNNKQASIDSVNAQAAAAVSYASSHAGAPPPGYFVIGDGPIIGPKQ